MIFCRWGLRGFEDAFRRYRVGGLFGVVRRGCFGLGFKRSRWVVVIFKFFLSYGVIFVRFCEVSE